MCWAPTNLLFHRAGVVGSHGGRRFRSGRGLWRSVARHSGGADAGVAAWRPHAGGRGGAGDRARRLSSGLSPRRAAVSRPARSSTPPVHGPRVPGRMVGLNLPVTGTVQQVIVTEPAPVLTRHLIAVANRHLSLKQQASGGFLVGGGWFGGFDAATGRTHNLRQSIAGNLWVCGRVLPALHGLTMIRSWTGINPAIDRAPILGEAPGLPGFYNTVTANGYTLGTDRRPPDGGGDFARGAGRPALPVGTIWVRLRSRCRSMAGLVRFVRAGHGPHFITEFAENSEFAEFSSKQARCPVSDCCRSDYRYGRARPGHLSPHNARWCRVMAGSRSDRGEEKLRILAQPVRNRR